MAAGWSRTERTSFKTGVAVVSGSIREVSVGTVEQTGGAMEVKRRADTAKPAAETSGRGINTCLTVLVTEQTLKSRHILKLPSRTTRVAERSPIYQEVVSDVTAAVDVSTVVAGRRVPPETSQTPSRAYSAGEVSQVTELARRA